MRLPKGKSSGVTSSRASGLTGSWETRCAVSIAPASGSSETKLVGDSRYSEPGARPVWRGRAAVVEEEVAARIERPARLAEAPVPGPRPASVTAETGEVDRPNRIRRGIDSLLIAPGRRIARAPFGRQFLQVVTRRAVEDDIPGLLPAGGGSPAAARGWRPSRLRAAHPRLRRTWLQPPDRRPAEAGRAAERGTGSPTPACGAASSSSVEDATAVGR